MLAGMIVIAGMASRLMWHIPNVTPVLALALFGGARLPRRQAVMLPLITMILSDAVLGLHPTIPFTWTAVVLVAMLGRALRRRRLAVLSLGGGLAAAVLFFIVTNLGAWWVMYPHDGRGLSACFAAAIPFFRNTLVSTVGGSVSFFAAYEAAVLGLGRTRFSRFAVGS